jgi:hypothetical protein
MPFNKECEALTVHVDGGRVVIEQPNDNDSPAVVSVPVHQIPLLISWIQEAKAEIEAAPRAQDDEAAARARGEG